MNMMMKKSQEGMAHLNASGLMRGQIMRVQLKQNEQKLNTSGPVVGFDSKIKSRDGSLEKTFEKTYMSAKQKTLNLTAENLAISGLDGTIMSHISEAPTPTTKIETPTIVKEQPKVVSNPQQPGSQIGNEIVSSFG